MSYKLNIEPNIFEQYSEYKALVIYARNIRNQKSNKFVTEFLREAENKQRQAFGIEKASSHPHVAAWRNAYKNFGSKPSKYRCSVEALLNRVLKGQALPAINSVVDLYNAISVDNILPVGGEDLDSLSSDLILKFSTGEEAFITYQNGKEVVEHPKVGEVIWADSTGVTCRRWNWRQCNRTALTLDTQNAYFVLDCLSSYSENSLDRAGQTLIEYLKMLNPDCIITQEVIQKRSFLP